MSSWLCAFVFPRRLNDFFERLWRLARRSPPRDLIKAAARIDAGFVILPAHGFHGPARLDRPQLAGILCACRANHPWAGDCASQRVAITMGTARRFFYAGVAA